MRINFGKNILSINCLVDKPAENRKILVKLLKAQAATGKKPTSSPKPKDNQCTTVKDEYHQQILAFKTLEPENTQHFSLILNQQPLQQPTPTAGIFILVATG